MIWFPRVSILHSAFLILLKLVLYGLNTCLVKFYVRKWTGTFGLALNFEAAGEGDAEAMMMEGSSSLDSVSSSSVSSPFFRYTRSGHWLTSILFANVLTSRYNRKKHVLPHDQDMGWVQDHLTASKNWLLVMLRVFSSKSLSDKFSIYSLSKTQKETKVSLEARPATSDPPPSRISSESSDRFCGSSSASLNDPSSSLTTSSSSSTPAGTKSNNY